MKEKFNKDAAASATLYTIIVAIVFSIGFIIAYLITIITFAEVIISLIAFALLCGLWNYFYNLEKKKLMDRGQPAPKLTSLWRKE